MFDRLAWGREYARKRRAAFKEKHGIPFGKHYHAVEERQRLDSWKNKVFVKLGDRCSNPLCSWTNPDGTLGCTNRLCLQIDHVNGGGNQDIRKQGHRVTYLRHVFTDTQGKYQLLCANCNWIKRHEHGENRRRTSI